MRMLRPFHPKRDIATQKVLEKTAFQKAVRRPAGCRQAKLQLAHHVRRRSALRPYRPPATVLAPGGKRLQVASQLIREYLYLYGTVSPTEHAWPSVSVHAHAALRGVDAAGGPLPILPPVR
jgi:hypothetical protein